MSYAASNFWSMNQIVFDTNAQAYIDAAGITQSFEQLAVNELILDLKNAGIWSTLYACYPFLGGSSASHGYNAVNTANYRILFTDGWTHSSTGAYSNGANGVYGNTQFIPSVVNPSSISLTMYNRRQTKNGYAFGVYTAGNGAEVTGIPIYTNGTSYAGFGVPAASFVTTTGRTASGLWSFQNNGTNTTVWKSGVQLATGARTRVYATASIHLSTIYNESAATKYGDGSSNEWAYAHIGTFLNTQLQGQLNNIINSYQQKLRRI